MTGQGGLGEALLNADSRKAMDLVWDSSLDLPEGFPGPDRYQPVIEDIYRGLGIPAVPPLPQDKED